MRAACKLVFFLFIVFTLTANAYSLTPDATTGFTKTIDLNLPGARNPVGDPPFKVCNKTRYKVNLAIAWTSLNEEPGKLISSGWWVIKQGDCVHVFGADSGHGRYYYAEEVDGTYTWTGSGKACVSRDGVFKYTNSYPASCPQGWEEKGFRYFDDKDPDLTEK